MWIILWITLWFTVNQISIPSTIFNKLIYIYKFILYMTIYIWIRQNEIY